MTANEEKPAVADQEQRNAPKGSNASGEAVSPPAQEETPSEDDNPSTWSTMVIFLALFLSLTCVGLVGSHSPIRRKDVSNGNVSFQDRSIVATAVPEITVEFNSLEDVGWYGSSFLLTMCCFQLLFGKLYAYVSIKWVFLVALAIFEIGSVVCAAAPSSTALIIGRAVAGIGAAGLLSGGLIVGIP